jgi:NAD(P)-dependent dehydrogenase (short-subunit alcohol dehydrogenase family)
MPGRLDGKVALITGTGGGQGRAAALAFTAEGARVVGCDLDASENERTLKLVEEAGGTMTGMAPIDLGDADASKKWFDEAAACYGGVDIVYNNASAARFGSIADISVEDWHFTIRNELDIVFFGIKFGWPHLVARGGGVILNTASIAGMTASREVPMAPHAAAKAGVMMLTRQAAAEGAPHGIRVLSISPGPIEVPTTVAQFEAHPEIRAAIAAATLFNRMGQPDEIAQVAVFLASDGASFMTGENVTVDGGQSAI